MSSPVSVSVERGVAVLRLDSPPVNALSDELLGALERAMDQVLGSPEVTAIVVTGARSQFVAGADLTRLQRLAEGGGTGSSPLVGLLERLESGPLPTVAAIDGFALGGGLELALACNARVATARASLGLPELSLGLIPGAGGTQRLPRALGVARALDLMLRGGRLSGTEAHELELVDQVAKPEELLAIAETVALELASGARPRRRLLHDGSRLPPLEEARRLAEETFAAHQKRYRGTRHGRAAVDAVLAAVELGPEGGLARERELFEEMLGGDAARALLHLFFAERAAAKPEGPGADRALDVARVGVVGGGTMGAGIAASVLNAGLGVTLLEAEAARLPGVRSTLRTLCFAPVKKGKRTEEEARALVEGVRYTTDAADLADADLVIEAVPEDLALKRGVFAALGESVGPTATLATNTSTLDPAAIAEGVAPPERVIGLHFFSPAHVMRLVEVVRTEASAPEHVARGVAFAKRLGKVPVTVRSCPGFLVNRVFMPYGQVSGWLVDAGLSPYAIDAALVEFGMPMGPFRMSDLAGLDVGLAAGAVLDGAYPGRAYRSALRRLLVEAGRLGEKSGRGHYRHEGGRALEDEALEPFLEEARARAAVPPLAVESRLELSHRVLFPVVNEACRCLEEGIVGRASDVDVATVLGMGFPGHLGGLLFWANRLGLARIHEALSRWRDESGLALFDPAPSLALAAARGGRIG